MSYASPVSSIADQAERAVASARFSTIGRKFGPRLPISTDYTEVGVWVPRGRHTSSIACLLSQSAAPRVGEVDALRLCASTTIALAPSRATGTARARFGRCACSFIMQSVHVGEKVTSEMRGW